METALARIPDGAAGELVTIDDRARHYERRSRADRTWGQYQSVWRLFSAWCNGRGLEPMPANIDTLKAYLTSLADEGRAVATINTYLAAICSAHSIAGHPLDRAPLKSILKGIRRGAKPQRQVAALVGVAIRKMLDEFRLAAPADARDGLILALGFAGAMRRSELAGLDWQEQGSGTGYLERVDGGLKITLVESKGRVGEIEEIIVPFEDMPSIRNLLDAWERHASLQPGEPLLRAIDKAQRIGGKAAVVGRLTDASVARIIKSRVRAHLLANGESEAFATAEAAKFSGHSLRAGFCTAAAVAGIPEWKIRRRSRHRTAALVARYVRAAEAWTDSGLKGVGF